MPFRKPTALPFGRFASVVFARCFRRDIGSVLPSRKSPGLRLGRCVPGEAVDLTITGKDLAGATSLWTSFPAEVSLAPDVKDNGKQADRVVFRVKAAANTLGVGAVRVVTPTGVSPLQLVVVDDLPSVSQDAGNKSPDKAQAVISAGRHRRHGG